MITIQQIEERYGSSALCGIYRKLVAATGGLTFPATVVLTNEELDLVLTSCSMFTPGETIEAELGALFDPASKTPGMDFQIHTGMAITVMPGAHPRIKVHALAT